MKFRITFLLLFFGCLGFAQCIPESLITAPGVYPVSDSIPCIVQGQPYGATLTFMFGDSSDYFPYNGENPIDSFRIDSITNLPCGITWATTEPLQYEYIPARAGCIQLSGTTTDPVGQYEIQIYYDSIVVAYIAGYGYAVFAVHDTITKDLRVIASGGNCPPVDTSLTGLASSCSSHKVGSPPPLTVAIAGKDTICSGDTTLLIANVTGNSGPVKYLWSPSIALSCDTCDSVYASPDTTITYTVIVKDSLNSDTVQVTISVNPSLAASVKILANADSVFLVMIDTNHYYFCPYITVKTQGSASYFKAIPTNGGTAPAYTWQVNGYNLDFHTDSLNFYQLVDSFQLNTSPIPGFPVDSIYDTITRHSGGTFLLTCQMTSSLTGCVVSQTAISIPDTLAEYCTGGISKASLDNTFKISPNPNNGTFLLSFDQPSQQLNIELLNIQGQSLYIERLKDVSSLSKEYNFNELAKGVYLLKITTENGTAVKRNVIQ